MAEAGSYSYELHYFPIHGLGATSRAILCLAGADWRDREQSFETWKDDKLSTPFGWLPILTIRGSSSNFGSDKEKSSDHADKVLQTIPEADVIERYLAKQFGFFGSTHEEELQISIFLSQTITIYNVWIFRVVNRGQAGHLDDVLKPFLEISLKTWIKNCERYLAENGQNGHFVGDKTSIADIKTAVILDMFLAVQGSDVYLNSRDAPGLWKLKQLVDTHPGYATYRRSETFKRQDEMTKLKVVSKFEGFDMSRAHIFA
ncbi:hypothetical protein BGZ99_008848 [Dissophora globulifera]|uniref:GST N-terminal domain-containing protein n=1 Tax=Dissophora globulifera TaxID=979702 RepID=A0A9P6R670_9FUNG|nr:hypothetical protein BGZ99_008848 [Dissophora globulifera]